MAGKKDRDDKLASYLTTFAKNRSLVTAVDVAVDGVFSAPVIDLRASSSALSNTIVCLASRAVGASGTIGIQLWRRSAGYPTSAGSWIMMRSVIMGSDSEVRFTDLLAAEYQLIVASIAADTSWNIFESNGSTTTNVSLSIPGVSTSYWTVGQQLIEVGVSGMRVDFAAPFASAPLVMGSVQTVVPEATMEVIAFTLFGVDSTGFTVMFSAPPTVAIYFNWAAYVLI